MSTAVETIEQLIRRSTAAELVPFLLALDKKEVVPVRTRALSLHKELEEYKKSPKGNNWARDIQPHQELMFFLTGLATYSQKEALGPWFGNNSILSRSYHQTEPAAMPWVWALLRHARPAWLTAWLLRQHRENPWITPNFDLLQQLTAEGLLDDAPVLLATAAVSQLKEAGGELNTALTLAQQLTDGKPFNPRQVPLWAAISARWPVLADGSPRPPFQEMLLAELQANIILLQLGVPLLFEHDTMVDTMAASDHSTKEYVHVYWLDVLPDLAASGHLSRAELLTNCLLALRRNFRRPLLSWFKDLFLKLEPTLEERMARQADLLELLAHPLTQVVNFALDQLKMLWLLLGFDLDNLLLYADNLLTRPDLKTGLKTLFSGFDKLVKSSPELAPALAPRYAAALAHPDAGVQERAAKSLAGLLGAKKPLLDAAALASTVADAQGVSELLSTPARTLLAPWLAVAPAPSGAWEAYAPRTGFEPDISAATAIAPVADWHELLFLTGQALQPDQPAEQERWLDGLLRLRGQYPADYAAQLRPYLLQAFPGLLKGKTEAETIEILGALNYGQHLASGTDLLRALLVSWYGGFTQPQVTRVALQSVNYAYPDPLLGLARQRLLAAEARLAPGAVPLPLLSTPTHQPFWVAPTALISKLLAYEVAGQTPDAADLALALGRLAWNAPTDAAAARQQLANLHHVGLHELLAWLLASSGPSLLLPPVKHSQKSQPKAASGSFDQWVANKGLAPLALAEALPWLWAVAARTRAPQGIWTELAALADYPGLAKPWRPDWGIAMRTEVIYQPYNQQQPERVEEYEELTIATVAPAAPPSPLLLYSLHAQLPQKHHNYFWLSTEDVSFLLSLLPNNPAPLQWHQLRSSFRAIPGYSEQAIILTKHLHTLLTDGPAYEEPASVLLAVGLLFDKPEARALAWEVLLAAVDTSRLVPVMLGQALGRLLAGAYAPVLRLGDALPAVRGISPATDDALRQLLEALLPELPAAPLRNTAKLLAAYADFRREQPLPAVVRARLLEWQAVNSLKKAATVLLN